MAVEIKNHSDGTIAGVTQENQLKTRAESLSLQHYNSWERQETYQVFYSDTGVTAGWNNLMLITNNSSTQDMVVTYMRINDGTSQSSYDTGHYISFGMGGARSSGGTVVTPKNTNSRSGKLADVTAYAGAITLTDTGAWTEIDKRFTKLGDEQAYNKEGSIIVGVNDSILMRAYCIGDGTINTRITIMMLQRAR